MEITQKDTLQALSILRSLYLEVVSERSEIKIKFDQVSAAYKLQIWSNKEYLYVASFAVPDPVSLTNDTLRDSAFKLALVNDPILGEVSSKDRALATLLTRLELQIRTFEEILGYFRSFPQVLTLDISGFGSEISSLFDQVTVPSL